jgi:hypothetical protein
MTHDPRTVLCSCRAYAQQVSAKTIYPEDPDAEFRRVWYCKRCNAWAEMDPETHHTTEGMGNRALHEARQLVVERLLESNLTPEEFRQEMDLKPWACKINRFTQQECARALQVLKDLREEEALGLLK